jgi:hypothetical protein
MKLMVKSPTTQPEAKTTCRGHDGSRLLSGEHRRLVDVETHIEGDTDEHGAEQERHPPSPIQERGAGLSDSEIDSQKSKVRKHQAHTSPD